MWSLQYTDVCVCKYTNKLIYTYKIRPVVYTQQRMYLCVLVHGSKVSIWNWIRIIYLYMRTDIHCVHPLTSQQHIYVSLQLHIYIQLTHVNVSLHIKANVYKYKCSRSCTVKYANTLCYIFSIDVKTGKASSIA